MKRSRFVPKKVSDGLRPFLDDDKAVARHGGHGYDDFITKLEEPDTTIKELMEYMHVKSYHTLTSWIEQYERELE